MPAPTIPILDSLPAWSRAIAAMPAAGPLPTRTVIVPRARVAHALRRELLRLSLAPALIGTSFRTLADIADAVVSHAPTEDARRPARVLHCLRRADLPLAYFRRDRLLSTPGWDDAFARTLSELESADLDPDDLPDTDPRWRDLATLWRALNLSAGDSWTYARTQRDAARLLEEHPARWPFPGPTLIVVDGREDGCAARLARAIPGARIAIAASRPMNERSLARLEALFGADARAAVTSFAWPRPATCERELLASYLFESPETLADPTRPRSRGPDGTVDLEEHAGVDEEIEAAVDWVARKVTHDQVPVDQIAVLVPAIDPLAHAVAQRLERLPWHDGLFPVHVAGGVPAIDDAAGARVLAVVRALRAKLSVETLATVVPFLSATLADGKFVSRGDALEALYSLGTAGGHAGDARASLSWPAAMRERERALAPIIAGTSPEHECTQVRRQDSLRRTLETLRALQPAVSALCDVMRLVIDEESLAKLWPALRDFLSACTRLPEPPDQPGVVALIDADLAPCAADEAVGALSGDDALRCIEDAIRGCRRAQGRYGDPCVYVGTVEGAVGLSFGAVRVIGLGEGSMPSVPREDPILPDRMRAKFPSVPRRAEAGTRSLHALDRVVRDARGSVVFSAPRVGVDGSDREPSSVLLDAAAALGRPHRVKETRAVVDMESVRRDAFEPSRTAARKFRLEEPVGASAWLDRAAAPATRGAMPPSWADTGPLEIARTVRLMDARADWTAMDGQLGVEGPSPRLPGLDPARPISASRLATLLQCPHRFLYSVVFGWDEPISPPKQREIDTLAYGGLFHRVMELFGQRFGKAFETRPTDLARWTREADAIAREAFEGFLVEYPLVGATVREHQLQRLLGDVHALLRFESRDGARRRYVDVERAFGFPEPIEIKAGSATLHVRGYVDRIDVEDEAFTLVRDWKTGKAHAKSAGEAPDVTRDLQVALYGRVAGQLAKDWNVPPRIRVAYTYVAHEEERSFRSDYDALERAATDWFETAADLLRGRAFPRTRAKGDCDYCAFEPVCGPDRLARAETLASSASSAVERFALTRGFTDAGDLE